MAERESGGIGRRARLRIWSRKGWGFESPFRTNNLPVHIPRSQIASVVRSAQVTGIRTHGHFGNRIALVQAVPVSCRNKSWSTCQIGETTSMCGEAGKQDLLVGSDPASAMPGRLPQNSPAIDMAQNARRRRTVHGLSPTHGTASDGPLANQKPSFRPS